MAEVLAPRIDPLSRFIEGRGMQFCAAGESLVDGMPAFSFDAPLDVTDASQNFVVAGLGWWQSDASVELLGEWRRVLEIGGRVAVLVDLQDVAVAVAARWLESECRLCMDRPEQVDGTVWLISGTRNCELTLRRLFSAIGAEVARADRPEAWRSEFFFDLAGAFLQAGEGQKAAECFAVVLASDAESLEARVGLALTSQSEWNEARTILSEVLNIDPGNSLATEWLDLCGQHAPSPQSDDPAVLTPSRPCRR